MNAKEATLLLAEAREHALILRQNAFVNGPGKHVIEQIKERIALCESSIIMNYDETLATGLKLLGYDVTVRDGVSMKIGW